MKKLILSILLTTLPFISHATGYNANYSFWQSVEDQQCRQRDLIDSGIANGQLTSREINKLRGATTTCSAIKLSIIDKYGHLSYDYQRELMSYLNHVTERINLLKYNGETNHHQHNQHQHNNYNRNPFARNNWRNERNNRHSVRINRQDGSAGFHFRF